MRQCASCNAVWREGPAGGSWQPAREYLEGAEHAYCPECTRKRESEVQRLSAMIEERVEARPEPAPLEEIEEELAAAPLFGRGMLVAVGLLAAVLLAAGVYAKFRVQQAERSLEQEPSVRAGAGGAEARPHWAIHGAGGTPGRVPARGPRSSRELPPVGPAMTTGTPSERAEEEPAAGVEASEPEEKESAERPTETPTSTPSSSGSSGSSSSTSSTPSSSPTEPGSPSEPTSPPEEPAPDAPPALPEIPVEPPIEVPIEPPILPPPDTPGLPPELPPG